MNASVSVVVPVRDGERFLAEALRSILAQTRPPSEVIVVDDGSRDGSAELARSFGTAVTVLEQDALGPGAARNTGVTMATGELVAFCDADDVWFPNKLERQLSLIDDSSLAVAVFCAVREFVEPGTDRRRSAVRAPHEQLVNPRLCSALLATRAAITATGPFDASSSAEWIDWAARLARSGAEVLHHPDVLVGRRIHEHNRSAAGPRGDLTAAVAAHLRATRRAGR